MRKTKTVLAMVLAVFMVLAMALPAFAEATSKAASGMAYRTVTVIGDSLATGYMIQNDDGTYVDHTHGARIADSWTSLVAEETGCVEYHNYAREGSGTNEVLRLLDKDYVPNSYFTDVSNAVVEKYFDGEEAFAKYQEQVQIDLQNSDLILLNCGSNDLFATVNTVIKKVTSGQLDCFTSKAKKKILTDLNNAVLQLVSQGNAAEAWATIYQVLSTVNMATDAVHALLECAMKGYANFQKNWGLIANKVHDINPNAKVVVISLFNGAQGLTVIPGAKVGIGNMLDPLFNGMNARIKSFNASRNYYTYIDITKVEHPAWPSISTMLSGNFYDYMMLCTHPTKDGHRWIANKVLEAI